MKISKKSQYGLRAMIYLAKSKKKIVSLSEIAKEEKIPFDYLEKIFSKLKKSGLIKTKKGVQGGYFLAYTPSKIKTGKIIKVLEDEITLVKCIKYFCPREKKCLSKNFWEKIQKSLNKTLNSLKLSDLIKK